MQARLLLLESPLESLSPLPADSRRLEFGASSFGARRWAGQRLQLRYAGAGGTALDWSVTLPWLYSSFADGGHAGRDNLLLGGGLRVLGGNDFNLRLGAELWLPFAAPGLAPLGERRAFGRLSLLAGGSGSRFRSALSWRSELSGLGPEPDEADDSPWPERLSLELRLGRGAAAGLGLFASGGTSLQFDGDERRQLGWLGGGARYGWGAVFSVELAGEGWLGLADDPLRPDYRLRLSLRRERILETPDETLAPGSELGGAPPDVPDETP